jgi:hypothetical protein
MLKMVRKKNIKNQNINKYSDKKINKIKVLNVLINKKFQNVWKHFV